VATPEELKETYRRIIDAISRGDADGFDDLIAPDIVDHNPIPDQAPGREGMRQWMTAVRTAMPDLRGTVEDVIAEGDRVAARVTWAGTHKGEFLGVAPTGEALSFSAFHHVRFSDEGAAEWWGAADLVRALEQMGATVSAPEAR
jgi:steroid delta-isomerase-like uncharacterized protein